MSARLNRSAALKQALVACLALVIIVLTISQWGWLAGFRVALVLGLLGAWAWSSRRSSSKGAATPRAPRLEVLERQRLSAHDALALARIDGELLLIVHGQGGAAIRSISRRRTYPRGAFR